MGVLKNLYGRANEKDIRAAYMAGAKDVQHTYAPVAGRLLQKGNGEVMKVYNETNRALDKMKRNEKP